MARRRGTTDAQDSPETAKRTRQDPFETTWSRVVEWLEAEPHRTAKELFERLQREHPGVFPTGQLRTVQRRVKDWRRLAARRLIFAAPMGPPQGAPVSVITAAGSHEREPDAAPTDRDHEVGVTRPWNSTGAARSSAGEQPKPRGQSPAGNTPIDRKPGRDGGRSPAVGYRTLPSTAGASRPAATAGVASIGAAGRWPARGACAWRRPTTER